MKAVFPAVRLLDHWRAKGILPLYSPLNPLAMPPLLLVSRVVKFLDSRQGARLASLVDQVLFSFASFVLTLVFIRTYAKVEFAAYGLGLFAILSIAGIYRTSLAIPAALWSPSLFGVRRNALYALHFCTLGVVLTLLGIAIVALLLIGASQYTMLIALALLGTATTYLSLDIDRVMLFRWRPLYALLTSSIYSIAIIVVAVTCLALHPAFAVVMLGIAVVGLCKTVAVGLLAGPPHWYHARLLFRRLLKTTVGWTTIGSMASTAFLVMPQWILNSFAIPGQVAGFTAVRTPMQPFMVIIRSLDIVDKVTSGRLRRHGVYAVQHHYRQVYFLYLIVSLAACTGAILFAGPIVDVVLGPTYVGFISTLRLTAVLLLFTATAAPLETVVYQQMAYRSYATAQIVGGVVGALCAVPLAANFGADGAVTASILGWLTPYGYLLRRFLLMTRIAVALRRDI